MTHSTTQFCLGELGTFRNGVNFNREQEGTGIPVVKVKDFGDRVISPVNDLDELDSHRIVIPDDQYLLAGDVVIVRSNGNPALVGRSMLFPGSARRVTFSGFCIRFRPDERLCDPHFIAYYIRSPLARARFTSWGSGTGIQNLSQDTLGALPVFLPPMEMQRQIASVLTDIDTKLDLNRQINQTLEQAAAAIFKSWFIDFDPVRAKANGAKSFPMMPQEVFDALPTEFAPSSAGPIPLGWNTRPLDEAANFLNGLALQKYPPRGDGSDLPVIKIAEMRAQSTAGADMANADVPDEYVVRDRDLLFSWSGTLEAGRWFGGVGALNQHLFKVTSEEFPTWFVDRAVNVHIPDFRVTASSKATTMGHINRDHLSRAIVVIPPTPALKAADILITPLYDLIAQNAMESRTLTHLRDSLLPKLLSGEVRVRDLPAEVKP